MSTYRPQISVTGFVLVIDDDVELAEIIGVALEMRGYVVEYAHDGVTGLHLAGDSKFDAIVLDKSLPGLDGVALCRRLRENRRTTPVLMLTGHTGLEDKIQALDAGADDYMCKPFDLRELEARLGALIRRTLGKTVHEVLTVGDLRLDMGTLEICREGRPITVGPVSLRILELLMRESPRVVLRDALERSVWGEELPDSDTLRSHVYVLRRAIDRPFKYPLIQTLPQVGYRIADHQRAAAQNL